MLESCGQDMARLRGTEPKWVRAELMHPQITTGFSPEMQGNSGNFIRICENTQIVHQGRHGAAEEEPK